MLVVWTYTELQASGKKIVKTKRQTSVPFQRILTCLRDQSDYRLPGLMIAHPVVGSEGVNFVWMVRIPTMPVLLISCVIISTIVARKSAQGTVPAHRHAEVAAYRKWCLHLKGRHQRVFFLVIQWSIIQPTALSLLGVRLKVRPAHALHPVRFLSGRRPRIACIASNHIRLIYLMKDP